MKGLQAEYQRLLDAGGGYEGSESAAEVKRLKAELTSASGVQELLQAAQAAQAVAERNAQVHEHLIPHETTCSRAFNT